MILVSGGSGLVGSYLIRELLRKGERVRAIYRSQSSIEKARMLFEVLEEQAAFEQIEWFHADLLDLPALEDSFKGVKKVYHAAAMVSFQPKDRADMFEINIEGTANMVNLALEFGIEKFCFVSSVAAIGKYRNGDCSDEEALWQNSKQTSDYAISKFYAENEVWRAAEEGLKMVIVNPSTIIGFGDWKFSSNALFKRVSEGLPFYPPGRNGFVAVEDVVSAMIQLMDSTVEKERFILSSENIRYRQLFQGIADGLNKKVPKISLRKWQAFGYMYVERILAFLGLKSQSISRANIRTAFSDRCYSNEKVKDQLGMKFIPISKATVMSGKLYRKYY